MFKAKNLQNNHFFGIFVFRDWRHMSCTRCRQEALGTRLMSRIVTYRVCLQRNSLLSSRKSILDKVIYRNEYT